MGQFRRFLYKEFLHILRDRKTLLILIGMPVSLIFIFGFALTNEVKHTDVVVLDQASDHLSQKLIAKISSSPYFQLQESIQNSKQIEEVFRKERAKVVVVFPPNFSKDLIRVEKAQIQLVVDGVDPNTSSIILNYMSAIIDDFSEGLKSAGVPDYYIRTITRMQYNPQMEAAPNFVPGVMALVLMLVCVMMTAISIVKEKEMGTMEVLLASPIKPVMLIVSKAFPYLVLSLINVVLILLLSVFVLDLPVKGSLLLLLGESTLFMMSSLSLGILISVMTSSQQVALLISLMGMLIPTILFSGFLFPIENMPYPLQLMADVVPARWFYLVAQGVMIKGVGFSHIWKPTLVLTGMTVFFFVLSLKMFKIRIE